MRAIPARRKLTTLALVTAAVSVALLASSVSTASAAPAALSRATNNCWLDVINDWLDNNRVDKLYPIPCYTQAIQHLNEYPDIQQYSSAIEDIHRAMLAAIHQNRGGGSGSSGPSSGGGSGSGAGGGGGSGGGGSGGGGSQGPIGIALHPSNAQSVPLPLIVLAALAGLLLLAAAGTWFFRRLQMRRMTPAPAPANTPRHRP